jgi:hypothetical protein
MTTTQVADHVDVSRREASRWLSRHGIKPLGREPGVGQKLYPAELVRERNRAVSPRARRYNPWRDVHGAPITVGCPVEQVAVAKEHGALTIRLRQRGEVVSLGHGGRGTRIQVRFAGETEPVGIRPHLVRVIR